MTIKSQSLEVHAEMGHRHQRAAIIALAGITALLLATEALRRGVAGSNAYIPSTLSELNPLRHGQYRFLPVSSSRETTRRDDGRICPTCNCSETGSYLLSPWNGQLPTLDYLNSPHATKHDFAQYLSHHLFVQSQADPVPVPETSRIGLLNKFLACPDSLFSFSFTRIKLRLPTAYAFTRTSGHGRLGASDKRIRYLARHADTIKEYYRLVETEGYRDGTAAKDRQLLWIVIEDDDHINPEIAKWLIASEIRRSPDRLHSSVCLLAEADLCISPAHIYVAHGPTR